MHLLTNLNKENHIETNEWFEKMISELRVDQLLIETDALEKQKKELYNALISGDQTFMHNYARKSSSAFFIEKLVGTYLLEILAMKAVPKRLAMELSNSKVLIWAEINDDDEKTEDGLILSAAKVNYEFSKYGFHVSSTIVEESDNLKIPSHYKEILISKN